MQTINEETHKLTIWLNDLSNLTLIKRNIYREIITVETMQTNIERNLKQKHRPNELSTLTIIKY